MRSVSDINIGIGARGLDLYLHAVPVLENDDVVGIVRGYGVTSSLEVQANRAPGSELLLGSRARVLSVSHRKPQDETNGETLHTHPSLKSYTKTVGLSSRKIGQKKKAAPLGAASGNLDS